MAPFKLTLFVASSKQTNRTVRCGLLNIRSWSKSVLVSDVIRHNLSDILVFIILRKSCILGNVSRHFRFFALSHSFTSTVFTTLIYSSFSLYCEFSVRNSDLKKKIEHKQPIESLINCTTFSFPTLSTLRSEPTTRMAEPISSPTPIYCNMCEMFSYSFAFFSESQACRKCRLFMGLEARLSELENRLRIKDSSVAPVASQQQLACADRPSLTAIICSPAAPEQPGSQGGWVVVRRKRSPKERPVVHHRPLHVANQGQ